MAWSRCMLDYYMGMSADLWVFVVAIAVHIHNRTYRRGIEDIPLRHLTRVTHDLSYLRTFGCPAYVHVPRANRSKVAPSSKHGIFVC